MVAALVVLSAPLACAQSADRPTSSWTLDRLLTTLAQTRSGRATFVDLKYFSMTTKPIESSGELLFIAPDHLEKITTQPKPERLVVDGDILTIERNQRKYTFELALYPELDALIEGIRATLAGNRDALERLYKVVLVGRGDDWTMTLTPLDAQTSKMIRAVTLGGTRNELRSVTIQQVDGDHSVMQLKNASSN
ncbi:MAG TPA: LolA-related protein [Pararobbsia sp.]|nr:LolA-related protein [Pararobbsia sp.]